MPQCNACESICLIVLHNRTQKNTTVHSSSLLNHSPSAEAACWGWDDWGPKHSDMFVIHMVHSTLQYLNLRNVSFAAAIFSLLWCNFWERLNALHLISVLSCIVKCQHTFIYTFHVIQPIFMFLSIRHTYADVTFIVSDKLDVMKGSAQNRQQGTLSYLTRHMIFLT